MKIMFDIASEKADYKTMYGTLSFVKVIFKCRRKTTSTCMYIEILTVLIFKG